MLNLGMHSEFDWKNKKTYYKNLEYYLDIEKVNQIEANFLHN